MHFAIVVLDTFYDGQVMQSFGDNHLLIFEVPSANDDEELLNAELRVLTIVEINSRQLTGIRIILIIQGIRIRCSLKVKIKENIKFK